VGSRRILPLDVTRHDTTCGRATRPNQQPSDINRQDNGANVDAEEVSEKAMQMLEEAKGIADEVEKAVLDEVCM
jgi:hypothetical protein